MNRIRCTVTLDKDAVSPDSIGAACSFLTESLFHRANERGVGLDWNHWHTYSVRKRSGDLKIVQWARVAKA